MSNIFKNYMITLGSIYSIDRLKSNDFTYLYPMFLQNIYNLKDTSMIEIGMSPSSIRIWLELFKDIHLYSLDIYNENYESERVTSVCLDQSNKKDLSMFKKRNLKSVSLIIDDGSHIPEHQLLTFNEIFPILEVDGIYIIENIQTSYWTKRGLYGYTTQYGYKDPKSIVEIFKNIVDCVNMEFIKEPLLSPINHLENIGSITFGKNCIIITKKKKCENKYLFEECL